MKFCKYHIYIYIGIREGKFITSTFDKVQSLNGRAIRALPGGKMRYETENAKFAQITCDYLARHLTGEAEPAKCESKLEKS